MSEAYDSYYDSFSRKKTLSERLHVDLPLLGGLIATLVLSLFVLYSASGQHYQMLLKQILHTGLTSAS